MSASPDMSTLIGSSSLACIRCRSCIWSDLPEFLPICPSYEKYGFYAFSGSGKVSLAKAFVFGAIDYDKSLADVFYKCTMCGACQENCSAFGKKLYGEEYLRKGWIKILDIVQFIREQLGEKGIIFPQHKSFLENTIKFGNPFAPKKERLKWTENLDFKIKDLTKEKAKVLFYPGCMYSLEPMVRDTTKTYVQILNKAGVDFGFLGENETCCGIIQLQLGDKGLFQDIARKNIKMLNNLEIETLVTPCPHCSFAFKEHYPKIEKINFEVLHVTQFLNRLIKQGKLEFRKPINTAVTFSDPCNLARFMRVTEEPREVLKSIKGIEMREMPRSKKQTWCCGAGGGVMVAFPDFMNYAANDRIKEAENTGSSIMTTACPWCEYSFKKAAEERSQIKILNIAELLSQAL